MKNNRAQNLRPAEEIFADKKLNDYSKLAEWLSSCDENEIKNNSLLWGAYLIAQLDNAVRKGSFDAFWRVTENASTDFVRLEKVFKWLLPKDVFALFAEALTAYKNSEACAPLDERYPREQMRNVVLPRLAERVANNYRYKVTLTEYDLIEQITPYLKEQGYKKKNKRWTKNIGEFTLVFYLQGSAYDVDDYYIRPGIFINNLPQKPADFYGHFMIDLEHTNVTDVIAQYEKFVIEWTNKPLIKKRVAERVAWEKRHPLNKRRALSEHALKLLLKIDPIPYEYNLFVVSDELTQYVSENF